MDVDQQEGWVTVEPEDPAAPSAATLLSAALPPTFELNGAVHACSSPPQPQAPTSWSLPGAEVTAQCEHRGHAGSGGGVTGIAVLTTLKNIGTVPLAIGRCELLRIPRKALPPAMRLLHYPLGLGQMPMSMVQLGSSETTSCNTFAMLHTATPVAGGMVAFLTWKRSAAVVDVTASAVIAHCDAAGFSLQPGDSIVLETAWISDWAAPQIVWEAWPSLAAKAMDARLPKQTPTGWLSWSWQDPAHPQLSGGTCAEDLYLQSAKALAEQGFCERGMDFLWLSQTYLGDSDGYTALPGAWTTEDKKQHPHGLAWLVEQVKALGFKNGLGLWCAPFWIPNIPAWASQYGHCCLQDKDGKPIVHGVDWRFSTPTLTSGFLCLDGSHPDAQAFIGAAYKRWSAMGISSTMCDFTHGPQDFWLGGGPEYAKYHDTKMVRGPEVFRGLIRAMRENAGDDFCLMACTGPDLCGVGLYDAARACEDSEEGRPHSFDPQGATYMQGSGNHGGNRQAVLVRTIAVSA